jgi:hypothetical protein
VVEDNPEASAAMLIQLDDHTLVDDMCAHFARSSFAAASVGGGIIEVARPDVRTRGQERQEILLHLRVWEVMNPRVNVTLVG